MAAGSNFAFKIAVKPLQIKTWLLLIAYRKFVIALSNGAIADLPPPLTTYGLPQYMRYRQTEDTSYVPKARPNCRPKT